MGPGLAAGPARIRGCLTRILDGQMLLWKEEVMFISDIDRSSPVPSLTKVMRGTFRASGSGRSATFSFMNLSGRRGVMPTVQHRDWSGNNL